MNRPPKVMHVVGDLAAGGVQNLLIQSLARFDESQFRHYVCCVSRGGVYERRLLHLGVPYYVMKRKARFDPTVVWQMARLMRTLRIDIVHSLNFTGNAWGRVAARLAGVPRVIAHERGTAWTESGVMRLLDRQLYFVTDLWLANSEAARIMLIRHVRVKAGKIRVVYNGAPRPAISHSGASSLRAQLRIGPGAPLVGTVGRLDTPKGLSFLLQAIPLVWQDVPNAHFVIVGDGPLYDFLRDVAEELGLSSSGQVHFLGFVHDASSLIAQLEVLAHPSIREPLGNVLIEAGYACRAVVATRVDGTVEVVVDGETGILIDPTEPVTFVDTPGASPMPSMVVDGRTRSLRPPLGPSPSALAGALVRLLSDPNLRREMGQAARARVERLFTLERYVQQLEAAYRDVL